MDCIGVGEGIWSSNLKQLLILFSIMSKWDDEFELQEEGQRRKAKQDKKNRNSTSNNDFYDLEEEPKNVKLPTIAKNPPPSNDKNTKSAANISLAEMPKRRVEPPPPAKASNYDEEDYELEESLGPNPSTLKQKSPKAEQKKTVSPPKKEERPEEEVYANEEFEDDKYEEDFEAPEESKPSPAGHKPKEQPKQQAKAVNVPKPAPKDRKGAESVAKKIEANKANSRNSIRSQSASRSAQNSRSKAEERKQEGPNKYTNLAEKTCPNYDRSSLEECNMDRLTRENDKIRGLIKKFNDELNELINRNIMQLKSKKEEKVVVAEDVLKVLEEQRNSNETALQTTLKELQRLRGKEGELREEEYHLSLDQKIAETKATLAEIAKAITKLKLQVNNEGNKLTKIDKDKEGNGTQEASNIKTSLITLKKDEERNDEMLEKLYIKFEELSKKIGEAEGRYNTQIDEAKTKGLSVQINPDLIKKAEDIKKKIQICRIHKSKTENLFKTKCEMISHECDQVRMQSKAVENSIQSCVNNCEEMQNESRKIVEKAKRGSRLSEDLLSTLENIISELESGTPVSNRDKDDGSTYTHPKGAKKYQSQKNVEKIIPQAPKEQSQDDSNLKKPTLFKKKDKEEEKQDERVWKDDKNNEPKRMEKATPIPELAKFENKEEVEKKDDEKKKPFVIKRNKQSKPQPEVAVEALKEELKIQKVELKKQAEKNEETTSLAPRMMKFRRNKPEEPAKPEQPTKQTIQKPSIPAVTKEEPKPEEKQPQEQDKPIFAPKRFNLKLKDRNSEQAGYVATAVQKKEEPKAVEQFKPKGLNIDKEPFSLASEPKAEPLKTIEPKIALTEEQEKPKFNLRLRDRQKESNKPESKVELAQDPPKQPEVKITIALDDKSKENNQFTNPYANAQAPKREREGPLKKQKAVQNVQKQNFNIYEQAEDISNVKELKIGESPKAPPPAAKYGSEEPNLHDLLGIKKNKQAVDEDLLVDAAVLGGKGKGKRESKKDTNFFGDLEI